MSMEVYEKIGENLNSIVKIKNYQVAPLYPKGKPGTNDKSVREFRLQLINKDNDTSKELIDHLKMQLRKDTSLESVTFNSISPNSSKFPSYSFTFDGLNFDIIIARGANAGEKFEVRTVKTLDNYFKTRTDNETSEVVTMMSESHAPFANAEIVGAVQRTGATKKEGIPIDKLGAIIGDIILTDNQGNPWYISLKDINGNTFSSYSGAASLFDREGNLQPNSAGATFLKTFGVDLNKVQAGFDERGSINKVRPKLAVPRANAREIEKIFNRAWGMNYFYVRRMRTGWKVFWLGKTKLDKLSQNIKIDDIRYPSTKSKQITILCSNTIEDYVIELRNSKAGEYPNDTKFKVKK